MRQVRSCGSVKAISLNRDEILRKLKELSTDIKKNFPDVREVRLFGSIARGEEHGLSDIDILVIVEELNRENFWEVYGRIHDHISGSLYIDFDLILLSEKDFRKNPERLGPTLQII